MVVVRTIVIAAMLSAGCEASFQAGGGASATPNGEATVVEPGPTPPLGGNGSTLTLRPGVYQGDLVVSGNANTLQGAGPGATIIEGRLLVSGNLNRVIGVRVMGATHVSGNGNALSGNDYPGGEPELVGNGNTR
jgi:hypothetical protein